MTPPPPPLPILHIVLAILRFGAISPHTSRLNVVDFKATPPYENLGRDLFDTRPRAKKENQGEETPKDNLSSHGRDVRNPMRARQASSRDQMVPIRIFQHWVTSSWVHFLVLYLGRS